MVTGYSQRKGIDYDEIFSPVVKLTSIRIQFSIVVSESLHLEQMDVKKCFCMEIWTRDLYAATGRIFGSSEGTYGVQAHQELVWTKASTKAVVQEILLLHDQEWISQS